YEKTWFSLLASLPIVSMSADRAAEQILAASSRGEAMITLSLPAKIATKVHALFPNFWSAAAKFMTRSLSDKVETNIPQPGYEVEDHLPAAVKLLNNRAARKNNEVA